MRLMRRFLVRFLGTEERGREIERPDMSAIGEIPRDATGLEIVESAAVWGDPGIGGLQGRATERVIARYQFGHEIAHYMQLVSRGIMGSNPAAHDMGMWVRVAQGVWERMQPGDVFIQIG